MNLYCKYLYVSTQTQKELALKWFDEFWFTTNQMVAVYAAFRRYVWEMKELSKTFDGNFQ